MIPVVLTPPPAGLRSSGRGVWVPRVLALVLALVSLVGAVAWIVTLSPFQLDRWGAVETSHTVTISEPGTYILFEEGPDAADRRGQAEVILSVRSIAGRPMPFSSLIDEKGLSPTTYDIRVHEGRAIAAIDFDRPGRYIIVSFAASALEPADPGRARTLTEPPGLALGPEGVPSAWGTWGGLAVLAGVPALAGLLVGGWARLRHPVPLGPVVRGVEAPRS